MKKRTVHILIAVTCLLLLIALELYLRAEYNLGGATSPIGYMFEQAAPWIIIAAIGVAAHDAINIRNRKETPLDAVMVKGFRVQEKKCTYGEEHTAILCLANCAKNTYTVTVTVTDDKNGNLVATGMEDITFNASYKAASTSASPI